MNTFPILDEIAKNLKVNPEEIKFRKDLAGTSTAKVSEISWGKSKTGILKQNTTKKPYFTFMVLDLARNSSKIILRNMD